MREYRTPAAEDQQDAADAEREARIRESNRQLYRALTGFGIFVTAFLLLLGLYTYAQIS